MCGIAGILSLKGPPPLLDELRSMVSVLAHRGPDAEGRYLDGRAGLAMRRLSIIDLENGAQPVGNEDGSIWTVFNGEIYNFEDLRRELEERGHRFSTRTDTETIVHLYEEDGERCVDRLRGMFAFAVWDARREMLLLARDRLGIKPLYYTLTPGRLAFASEIKALLPLADVTRDLDWRAVNRLFTSLSTPPATSILRGVLKLEPGHVLTISPGDTPRLRRYWEFRARPDTTRDAADLEEELRARLEDAVRSHLVSDVPIGAFLSGGIDSSAVAALMSRLGGRRIKTFSIGFGEERFDESGYARLAARAIGSEHREAVLTADVPSLLEDLVWHMDEPSGDASAIPTYVLSRLAAEEVKVVLSGDGGDEIFAGYEKYLVEQRERRFRLLPAFARRTLGAAGRLIPEGVRGHNLLRHVSLEPARRYLDASTLFHEDQRRRLFHPDIVTLLEGDDPLRGEEESLRADRGHWLTALQSLDVNRYLPLDILPKVDRMSMAHSLEVRVPLLDHQLVEFAATIPPGLLLRGGTTKYLFRRVLSGLVPPTILARPKQGFAVPLGAWFRGRLRSFVRDILLSETTRRRGILGPAYLRRLLDWHDRGRELDLHLWTILNFELWCRIFLDPSGRGRPCRGTEPPRPVRVAA